MCFHTYITLLHLTAGKSNCFNTQDELERLCIKSFQHLTDIKTFLLQVSVIASPVFYSIGGFIAELIIVHQPKSR